MQVAVSLVANEFVGHERQENQNPAPSKTTKERPRIIKGRPFLVGCGCCALRSNQKPTERNAPMDSLKYVGLDVHRDTISVAVLDEGGKLVMQSIVATHAAALLDFV